MIRSITPLEAVNEFRQMEQVFDRLFGQTTNPAPATATHVIPLDVMEQEGKFIVRAAVPGIAPDQIEVSIDNNVLTIRGEVENVAGGEGIKVYRRENVYGTFSRSLRLPEKLNLESIEAENRNGVLTISIPRIIEEKPQPLRIPVKTLD